MVKPKMQICENDILPHVLDKEAIGLILLNNKNFKQDLNQRKRLKYDFFMKDYKVINGTTEGEYTIYNVNIRRKRKAGKALHQQGRTNN